MNGLMGEERDTSMLYQVLYSQYCYNYNINYIIGTTYCRNTVISRIQNVNNVKFGKKFGT